MKFTGMRIIGLGLLLLALQPACVFLGLVNTAREDFALTAQANGVTAMNIVWENGRIVFRVDPQAAEITASGEKVVVAGFNQDTAALFDEIIITLEPTDDDPSIVLLIVDAPSSQSDGLLSAAVEVTVVVPAGLALNIDVENTNVEIIGNTGVTTIDVNQTGSVLVTDQTGDTEIRANVGNIEVTSNTGSVEAETDTGRIEIEAAPAQDDVINASTDTGSIVIRIPRTTSTTLDLHGGLGDIDADLADFVVTNLSQNSNRLFADLNDGGAAVSAETDVGNIDFGPL